VRNGTVTLSGTLDFDYQRRPLLRAASGVDGVHMVIDQLKVKAPSHWDKQHDHGSEVQF
jgi:osmotically-inducible protein OsmY